MTSLDIQPHGIVGRKMLPERPHSDVLGRGLFYFHLAVGVYVLLGWVAPFSTALAFYLVLLPAMAAQWRVNRGSCILNNFESWLRSGNWHDPRNAEEGHFVAMLSILALGIRPHAVTVDRLSYGLVGVLWLLGLVHFAALYAPQGMFPLVG